MEDPSAIAMLRYSSRYDRREYVGHINSNPRPHTSLFPRLSVDEARTAITAIDHAIDEVNRERSYIGSEQNKLQFTMSNLTSQTQSIEAARSSIQDTDFAADAAELAKNQILAQSATAMLAQASAISQNILSLIAT